MPTICALLVPQCVSSQNSEFIIVSRTRVSQDYIIVLEGSTFPVTSTMTKITKFAKASKMSQTNLLSVKFNFHLCSIINRLQVFLVDLHMSHQTH